MCVNCHKHKYREVSRSEKLCNSCLLTLDRVDCSFCQRDFHLLTKNKAASPVACKECFGLYRKYGEPQRCVYCNQKSAFQGTKCAPCTISEQRYGQPVGCEKCFKINAFKKPGNITSKVVGQLLCLLCTRSYKAEVHRKNKQMIQRSDADTLGDTAKFGNGIASKKPRLSMSNPGGVDSTVDLQAQLERKEQELSVLRDDTNQRLEKLKADYTATLSSKNLQVEELRRLVEQKERLIVLKEARVGELEGKMLHVEERTRLQLQSQKQHYEDVVYETQNALHAVELKLQERERAIMY